MFIDEHNFLICSTWLQTLDFSAWIGCFESKSRNQWQYVQGISQDPRQYLRWRALRQQRLNVKWRNRWQSVGIQYNFCFKLLVNQFNYDIKQYAFTFSLLINFRLRSNPFEFLRNASRYSSLPFHIKKYLLYISTKSKISKFRASRKLFSTSSIKKCIWRCKFGFHYSARYLFFLIWITLKIETKLCHVNQICRCRLILREYWIHKKQVIYIYIYIYMSPQSHCGDEEAGRIGLFSWHFAMYVLSPMLCAC